MPQRRGLATLSIVAVLWLVSCARPTHIERLPDYAVPVPAVPDSATATYRQGAHLYRVASCVGCHSPPFDDATHLGGGRDLPVIFGTFYAPNISPDPEHGIGSWTEADFVRAMRQGRAPDGHRYWPTFPYMTYTQMTDDDLHALWVYLAAQPAVPTPSRAHEVNAPYSLPGMLGLWRRMAFRAGPLNPEPDRSERYNRGRYLVKAVSYCDQCHTPRSSLGLVKQRHFMAGGANAGKSDVHPNLTPDKAVGLGDWTTEEIAHYLATGDKPDGTSSPPTDIMSEKIHDSFSHYNQADRTAIAVFLQGLEPDDFDPAEWSMVRRAKRKEARAERREPPSSP